MSKKEVRQYDTLEREIGPGMPISGNEPDEVAQETISLTERVKTEDCPEVICNDERVVFFSD